MPPREEIREGLEKEVIALLVLYGEPLQTAKELAKGLVKKWFRQLGSQDVVIKVDRELPYIPLRKNREITSALIDYKHKIEEAGYEATIPLEEE